eukprot:2568594-Prymnesium_polylepis.2
MERGTRRSSGLRLTADLPRAIFEVRTARGLIGVHLSTRANGHKLAGLLSWRDSWPCRSVPTHSRQLGVDRRRPLVKRHLRDLAPSGPLARQLLGLSRSAPREQQAGQSHASQSAKRKERVARRRRTLPRRL